MNLAMFSLWAWGELPAFMILLISSPESPTSICISRLASFSGRDSRAFPLFLGLPGGVFSHVVGIGLSPNWICLVLQALWLLAWSPLQLIHLGFSLGGCLSVS